MPETVPVIAGTNHFSLDTMFGTSAASAVEEQEFAIAKSGTGNFLCGNALDKKTNYSQEAAYCGGESPDIATDLDTLATAFGGVVNSIVPTSIRLHFEAGKHATVSIEGHNHAVNAHTTGMREADWSSVIPASAGVGVPTFLTVAGTCSPISADLTVELEHIDKIDADGDHFGGQNTMCKVTLSVDYEGTVSGATAGSWLNVLISNSSGNEDTPTSNVTAEQYFDSALPA